MGRVREVHLDGTTAGLFSALKVRPDVGGDNCRSKIELIIGCYNEPFGFECALKVLVTQVLT